MKLFIPAVVFFANLLGSQVFAQQFIDLDYKHEIYDLAFNRDGTRLATGGKGGGLRVWNTATWQEIAQFSVPDESAQIAARPWSPATASV